MAQRSTLNIHKNLDDLGPKMALPPLRMELTNFWGPTKFQKFRGFGGEKNEMYQKIENSGVNFSVAKKLQFAGRGKKHSATNGKSQSSKNITFVFLASAASELPPEPGYSSTAMEKRFQSIYLSGLRRVWDFWWDTGMYEYTTCAEFGVLAQRTKSVLGH